MVTSAWSVVIEALDVLFVVMVSPLTAATIAEFTVVPEAVTTAVKANEVLAPAASAGTAHVRVPETTTHPAGAVTVDRPTGMTSVREVLGAGSPPTLVTWRV
jgi:hypothetical protein